MRLVRHKTLKALHRRIRALEEQRWQRLLCICKKCKTKVKKIKEGK